MLGQKESGEYKGVECLKLLNHTEEKKKKLTLQDFLCRKDEGQFDMIDFDEDEYSIVKLYKHIVTHFLPPTELGIDVKGCFFRRIASEKELKVGHRFILLYFSIIQLIFCFSIHHYVIRKGRSSVTRSLLGSTKMMCGVPVTSRQR